jgi:hypothetical protein
MHPQSGRPTVTIEGLLNGVGLLFRGGNKNQAKLPTVEQRFELRQLATRVDIARTLSGDVVRRAAQINPQ